MHQIIAQFLPAIAFILIFIFTCYTYYAKIYIEQAAARNAQLQVNALCHEIERTLQNTRNQLLMLAAEPNISQERMTRRMTYRIKDRKNYFRELAFIGRDPENRFVLINNEGAICSLSSSVIKNARNNPFERLLDVRQQGYVSISEPMQVTYSMVPVGDTVKTLSCTVIRFSTPIYADGGDFIGILLLSLDISALRDSLTLFSSPSSPLHDTQSDFQHVRSVFFDTQGWMLFQSEAPEAVNPPLSTDAVRSGLNGDFGRPGFSIAFRPSPVHEEFWAMVTTVQAGKGGQSALSSRTGWNSGQSPAEFLSYSPVTFRGDPGSQPKVVGGVATLDTSYNAARATSLLWAALALCLVLSICIVGSGLHMAGRRLRGQLEALTAHVREQNAQDTENALPQWSMPQELQTLSHEIDITFSRLRHVRSEHDSREHARNARWRREPAQDMPAPPRNPDMNLVGGSAIMEELRGQIRKAASVFADVLVIGETGTGKEAVSAAIHQAGPHRDRPYISINCGALDENLLMDTLFGHVKGAFTEARSDRKGAFLAAEGGTLMLDELGNAAPRVQQALLRALSTRHIRPLGSDQEIAFNARIVAATNVDLREEARSGSFREDLYYRLAVITIRTPPLRRRKEDIPLLTSYFLDQAAQEMGREPAAISKGALEKLLSHDWPGNVRQLKNTITRALAFSEHGMIYAESILFHEQGDSGGAPHADVPPASLLPQEEERSVAQAADGENLEQILQKFPLNKRQRAVFPALLARGGVTRQEYQELAGEKISTRTAQYDLQEMVGCGLLRREGRGPAMRYVPATPERER